MKCPHCNYSDGYSWEEVDGVDQYIETNGDHGKFWGLPIKLERGVGANYNNDGERRADVVGCPKCKKLFLEE